jgi:UDPglucose 6-dehydrogenase
MQCGVLGLSHLGLIYSTVTAHLGWNVVQFDTDSEKVSRLESYGPDIFEPELSNLWESTRAHRVLAIDSRKLSSCDLLIVAPDVGTSQDGESDLSEVRRLTRIAIESTDKSTPIVIMSQVPPGFTRSFSIVRGNVFYQVETLIFGQAVQRAMNPERLIVGTIDGSPAIPDVYRSWLREFRTNIHIMRLESAELTKIGINLMLAAALSTTNSLAELSEAIGADWSEIVPALREDRRIGEFAYVVPGLGIAGGNIERDLATFSKLAASHQVDPVVIKSFVDHSKHRKGFVAEQIGFRSVGHSRTVGILGISYKPGTSSTRNSPTLLTIGELGEHQFVVHDPIARLDSLHDNARQVESVAELLSETDSLAIMTPWPDYAELLELNRQQVIQNMDFVVDPFGLLPTSFFSGSSCEHIVLGRGVKR